MQKQKKKSGVAKRAWNILRLAARKGGVFKSRLMLDFLKSNFIGESSTQRAAIYYGERELSLDDTPPIIHLKMHRPSSLRFRLPRIPCINPHQLDFDYNFDFNDDILSRYKKYDGAGTGSFSNGGDADYDGNWEVCEVDQISCCEEVGIDVKAEEFIANFYEQMKMQRQVSDLQYNEMLNRGTS